MNNEVKQRKPNNVNIYDMSDADYLAHVAEKILKGQRPRPRQVNPEGDHVIIWTAIKRK